MATGWRADVCPAPVRRGARPGPLVFARQVRVRVKEVRFHPIPTPAQMRGTAAEPGIGTDASPYRPMEVIADMNADGLGSVGWWSEAVAE